MTDELPGDVGRSLAAVVASLGVGSRVAGYRLEEQIGRGGMAVVYRALDERLGRQVALKILAPVLAVDEAFRRRFIGESRAAAAVDDPHIIPVYEAGEAGGVLFIAMRYVPGGDVRTLLRREGPLGPARTAAIISPMASALDAAHAARLIHRDVKPANMLVAGRPDRPDHVYLSDFGLNLNKGELSTIGLTEAGQILGTPNYSAPEQIQGQNVDGRTDQYALACTAFELLTGQAPFQRDLGMAVLWAHLSEPPPPLSSRRPGLPAVADQVFARALAKVPGSRYASCREFADALRQALGLAPYHSGPGAIVDTVAGSDRDRIPGRGKRPRVWAAGAVAALLVAAALIWDLARPASTARTNPVSVYSGGSYGFKHPWAVAIDGSHVWVANYGGNSLTELNASDGRWVRTLSGAGYGISKPWAIAVEGSDLWVANIGGNSVTELSASDGRWLRTLSGGSYGFNGPDAIAFYGSHVWVANSAGSNRYGSLTELNASDGSWVRTLAGRLGGFSTPTAIAVSGAHLWIANGGGHGSVTELNASDGSYVQLLSGGNYGFDRPNAMAVGGSQIWVANASGNGGSVTVLDATNGGWVITLAGGSYGFSYPGAIAIGGAHVWVTNANGRSVTEMNVSDGGWKRTLLGRDYRFNYPVAVAVGGGHVWVVNADGNSVTELPAG